MSDGSSSDSDAELIDLTGGDNYLPDIDGHYNDTPDQEEISLGVDAHGEPISHMIYRPGGPMDVDNEEASSDDGQDTPEVEGSLFFGDDDDGISNGDGDDGGRRGPPSPPSSDDPGSEIDGSEDSDNHHDDDDDDDQSQATQSNPEASNGGSSGGDDSGDDSSDDEEDSDDDEEEGNEEHGHKNPNGDVPQVLAEESVEWPEWNAECLETCQPPWYRLARKFADYRNRFLFKRNELRECKRVNRCRVTGLNHLVTALKEAVREFYAANEANIQENERLVEENDALRRLVTEAELDDFPDPVHLRIEDMEASLPQEMRDRLPPDVKRYLRVWRRGPVKPRKTERLWPKAYTRWIRHGSHPDYNDWGDIYKLCCQEENMSWALAFGRPKPLKTHPHLILCAPTAEQEERVITGEGEVCTPVPYYRRKCAQIEDDISPFDFNVLATKDRLMIIIKILQIGCKLQHLQHIELLWMGSQKLTYRIDQKGKYTSRRTHDLAYLPEACRLKTVAIHLPESSEPYMRRKHEPPQIVEFLTKKTRFQPNFRRFRALRTLQGVDYLYCLRGVREITFFDYDQWHTNDAKMPVRDWTFVRDINESVRREKSANDEHFSQLRYLAPLLIQPSVELAEWLEEILNPEPQRMGLLSPPPDMYPQPQAALEQANNSEDESDDNAGDEDYDEDMGGDTDDDDGGGGGDGAAGAHFNYQHLAADGHGLERSQSPVDLDEVAAELSDILSYDQSDSDSEQERKEEVWSDNGQIIDLMSDDEDDDGPQYGRDRSTSLFIRSPPREHQPEFTTKVESPSPPRETPPALANQDGITPVRETRADSSLFVSPTPYEALNPQAGDRSSPIDLTEHMGVSFSSPAPSSRSSSSSCSPGIKREWSFISVDDDDENDGDDEDEDQGFRLLGSFPKRPRLRDGDGDGDGAEMMAMEEDLDEEFVLA
ncbi:Halomucin [Fusarium oxysporum f. sp. rapae]|uniref:Halomucin n=1 Tax=Fusarium oxysporum f. sp. rapae TaxID=485398 RepID=A0A8J5U797_FUSOX|nr:Halomucin [Fusarium oxysporum f. sp. rapae]